MTVDWERLKTALAVYSDQDEPDRPGVHDEVFVRRRVRKRSTSGGTSEDCDAVDGLGFLLKPQRGRHVPLPEEWDS